jgi:RHS repeat-associated protein
MAQSVTDGSTPAGIAPGKPAGSYALSEVESVSLFGGNLNFTIPLLKVGGRGEAQHSIMVPIESHWTNMYFFSNPSGGFYNPIPMYNLDLVTSLRPGYGPGVLVLRGARMDQGQCPAPYFGNVTTSQTRLTFISGDGTEFELRDPTTDGAPLQYGCSVPTPNRGNVFVSNDGTAATFLSDATIGEQFVNSRNISGYLMLRDGTRYRIDNGLVSWTRDRNGNQITYTYTNDRVTSIKDSLDREVTIQYGFNDIAPYGVCDRIKFKGSGGLDRYIRISYSPLSSTFAAGYAPQSKNQLFPAQNPDWVTDLPGMTSNFEATVISSVWLPDGRRYRLFYNSYGELARAELPTGGALEHVWESTPQMHYQDPNPQEILRRLKERRIINGGSTEEKTTYTYSLPALQTGNTIVTVDRFDGSQPGKALSQEKHYFFGSPVPPSFAGRNYLFTDSPWTNGREFQTDVLGANGTPLLRRVTNTWKQRANVTWCTGFPCTQATAPSKDPRLVETITTLSDTNQVSKKTSIDPADPSGNTVGFDQYNNQTDVWEYDFGAGQPGAFSRRTHNSYVTTGTYVNANTNPALGAHLRSLRSQSWISSDTAGSSKRALTVYEYDNYVSDSRHQPLLPRASITGHATNSCTPTNTCISSNRGNLTGTTSYSDAASQTGPVTSSSQYDIAGNIVATVDARGNLTTLSFSDSFCNGSTCGGSFTPNTFAFASTTTSPVPDPTGNHGSTTALLNSVVYDFWTGNPSSATDPNGQTSSFEYNDTLDRVTAVIRPTGNGRTDYEYGDAIGNLYVRTLTDLDVGRRIDSRQFFDGLGRLIETRSYENATDYISVKQVPFSMLQDPDTNAWLAVNQISAPYRPLTPGAQPDWTTTFLDSLGRNVKLRTPDNAIIRTSYSGNAVTVTDQTGKARKSVTDAFGRLVELYEDPSGLNYQTKYTYNVLDGLVKVEQGSQLRFFMYDSLKRLIRADNPEQETLSTLNLTDPVTNHSNWSASYDYDNNGNLTSKTDARGVVTQNTYDALNRPTIVLYRVNGQPDPNTGDIEYLYDNATNGKGRLWLTYRWGSKPSHTSVGEYDAMGRVKQLWNMFGDGVGGWSVGYGIYRNYNFAGQVTSQNYPSGRTVNYSYDNAGRTSGFTGNLGDGATRTYASSFLYNARNQVTQELFGTQTPLYHKLQYNNRGQLWDVRVSTNNDVNGSANRGTLQYFYEGNLGYGTSGPDNNGNLLFANFYTPEDEQDIHWAITRQRYNYDVLNRLKSVTEYFVNYSHPESQQSVQTYDYDRWGNRTINTSQTSGVGINNTAFEIDTARNRLYSPGDLALSDDSLRRIRYDQAGNQIKNAYLGYGTATFDGDNHIVAIQDKFASSSTYTYNANAQRVRRRINNQETWQIYGIEGELVAEYAANSALGTPQKEYGYRDGQLLITAEASLTPAPTSGLIAHWKFDENTGTTTADSSGNGHTGTLANGPAWTTGQTNAALSFDGSNDQILNNGADVTNNFTISFWAQPTTTHQIDSESTSGFGGTSGQRYMLWPFWNNNGHAGAGVSVGSNGVSVYEHADNYMPALLVYSGSLSGWTHVTVVYENKQPKLYLNGTLVRTGLTSPMSFVHLNPAEIGGDVYGYYAGKLDELRIYNRALSPTEVATLPNGSGTSAQVKWLVPDHLGTPRIILDQTGAFANLKRHDYLPFGEELPAGTGGRTAAMGYATGDNVRQQFTSKERDNETGLDFFGARFFASAQGRFTGADNPGFSRGTDPQTWNLYSYTANNPLRRMDPNGRDWFQIGDGYGARFEWHEGKKYTYTDSGGKKRSAKNVGTHLLVFEFAKNADGTIKRNSDGAALGTLTLYNQNRVAAQNTEAFTGGRDSNGNQFNDMRIGVYTIRTDIRSTASDDTATTSIGGGRSVLKPIYGLQEIDRSLGFAEPWGTKRAALNEWDPNLPIEYRGNYLHGHERTSNTTAGCICDRPQTVLDAIFGLNATVTPRVKVVVTDGAPRSGDPKPGPYVTGP